MARALALPRGDGLNLCVRLALMPRAAAHFLRNRRVLQAIVVGLVTLQLASL